MGTSRGYQIAKRDLHKEKYISCGGFPLSAAEELKEVTFLTLKETNFIENISGSFQFSRDI